MMLTPCILLLSILICNISVGMETEKQPQILSQFFHVFYENNKALEQVFEKYIVKIPGWHLNQLFYTNQHIIKHPNQDIQYIYYDDATGLTLTDYRNQTYKHSYANDSIKENFDSYCNKLEKCINTYNEWVIGQSLDRTYNFIAVSSEEGSACIMNFNTQERIITLQNAPKEQKDTLDIVTKNPTVALSFNDTNSCLITADSNGIMQLFDIDTISKIHKKRVSFQGKVNSKAVCFGPLEKYIVSITNKYSVPEICIFKNERDYTLQQWMLYYVLFLWICIKNHNHIARKCDTLILERQNGAIAELLFTDIAQLFNCYLIELHNIWQTFTINQRCAIIDTLYNKLKHHRRMI